MKISSPNGARCFAGTGDGGFTRMSSQSYAAKPARESLEKQAGSGVGSTPARGFMGSPIRKPADPQASWIEFGVPIEVIEPAIVQIVRRKQPAVAVELMHGRREGLLFWEHPRLLRRQTAFTKIARGTGGDHVFPSGLAALAARDDVIEGQVVARRAILADEAIAQEYVKPGEGRMGGRLDERFQRHHARQLNLECRAAYRAVVMLDNINAVEEHRLDRVLPRP